MKRKIYFPLHLGSGNRGCEGIIRGILKIHSCTPSDVIMVERDIDNYNIDKSLSLDSLGELKIPLAKHVIARFVYNILRCLRHLGGGKEFSIIFPYINVLHKLCGDDIVYMTGGDLYCYENTLLLNRAINSYVKNKGAVSLLVGCSLDESLLSELVLADLRNYDSIICRESLSYNMLLNRKFTNVFLIPDPAFVLDPQRCSLPKLFINHDIVGINISNFVNFGNNHNTLFMKSIYILIDYIINELKLHVLLIPHVFWPEQNDVYLSNIIKQKYHNDERVALCSDEHLNYCQIRYIISKCRFFVGARTHAMISAYSSYVPAMALGYSTKSIGIAKDIGLPEYLVINSKYLSTQYDLLENFKRMVEDEYVIKNIYSTNMPSYRNRAFRLHEILARY